MDYKKNALKHLKSAQGQLNASYTMLENDRYCVDVSNQILATIAQLKRANEALLKQHMKNCVHDAFETGNGDEKIDEVLKLVSKMID